MALTVRPQSDHVQRGIDPDVVAFQRFFGMLVINPAVEIVAADRLSGYVNLWVRLTDDNEAHEYAVYDALRSYHASDGVQTPIDLHLVFADEPETAFPSQLQILFRRPR
jgi:hypothetical protein